MKPAKTLLLLLVTHLLTTCVKPVRDNPWDELSILDPLEWAPKNIRIDVPSITQRTLSWEYSCDDGIQGFKIDRKRGGENWHLSYKELTNLNRSLNDTITLNPTIKYQYRIYAFAGKNTSSVVDTAFNATIPAPEDLGYTINSPTSITLNWDYPTTGHEGFQLERKTNEGPWNVIAPTINPETSTYTDNQINLNQNYYAHRLRAYANSIFSDYVENSALISIVTNPATGKTWMDRNLGASRVAQSIADAEAYGDLYQWGRLTDGHEKRASDATFTVSTSNTPGHDNFILVNSSPYDWRSPQNNNLWQGVSDTNNPCPPGYRLPTEAEWEAERQSWSSNNAAGAFNSPLKLPVAGYRHYINSSLDDVGSNGRYWSATVGGSIARSLFFYNGDAGVSSSYRAYGFSVRCIKD